MAAIPTRRCPSCGILTTFEQTICNRCLAPIPAVATAPTEAVTGETCHFYRAANGDASLLLSRGVLEYTAPGITLVTPWHNVESIRHGAHDDQLWFYQTPQHIKIRLGSSRDWFSNRTRAVPLRQFGYPANQALCVDLLYYAPHLRRYLHLDGIQCHHDRS